MEEIDQALNHLLSRYSFDFLNIIKNMLSPSETNRNNYD